MILDGEVSGIHDDDHESNVDNQEIVVDFEIHGILGQTFYNRVYNTVDKNLRYLEGTVEDYEVSNIFADDFTFNKYH